MSKENDKTSDAERSDPAVADRNREELAKEAARGLKKASHQASKEGSNGQH